ncbi:MAG: pirin family protein [Alphaproteobacteria bacterium]|nr:pirin family protein [Alphaproteobacteria bacterium]
MMQTIKGKTHDLGDGFEVSRVLPQIARRTIGPFVFFDYFGPVDFPPGKGIDVRPHPHIGLATVTYLFEGSQVHRDSIGSVKMIQPGDVNWMTAGRGIVHSERTAPEVRAAGHRMHGIQSWVGLPQADEECPPEFQSVAAKDLPTGNKNGIKLRVITGDAYGLVSPVRVFSDIFYVDARLDAGAALPIPDDHIERAAFIVQGDVQCGGARFGRGDMILFDVDEAATLAALTPAHVMLLGGAPLDGPRHVWWNFVSSDRARIERAKAKWEAGGFDPIPGEHEFIPLPH